MAQAPEIGCLEDEVSFWGPAYFQQPITMLVSGSVSASPYLMKSLLSAAFFFPKQRWRMWFVNPLFSRCISGGVGGTGWVRGAGASGVWVFILMAVPQESDLIDHEFIGLLRGGFQGERVP